MSTDLDMLKRAEDALYQYMRKGGTGNAKATEAELSKCFSAVGFPGPRKTFEIHITKSRKTDAFFGAMVYPKAGVLDKLAQSLVLDFKPFEAIREIWQGIDSWVIEIDSGCFDTSCVNLTPAEIIAILLHEVGHTVYSDRVISRIWRCYRAMYISMKNSEKFAMKAGYAIFMAPMAVACGIRPWNPRGKPISAGRNGVKEEMFADSFATKYGYGDDMLSGLGKIISAYGSAMVNISEKAADETVIERMRWARLNISDVVKRRNNLSNEIFTAGQLTNSDYMKGLYSSILGTMGTNMRERYSGMAVECTVEILSMANALETYSINTDTMEHLRYMDAIESMLNSDRFKPGTKAFESFSAARRKKGLPSWIEIDRIQIQIDKMTNHRDRDLVLDMIYDLINDITEYMEWLGPNGVGSADESEAKRMLAALDQMREQVLNRNSFSKSYRVFVKSPDGYDG